MKFINKVAAFLAIGQVLCQHSSSLVKRFLCLMWVTIQLIFYPKSV